LGPERKAVGKPRRLLNLNFRDKIFERAAVAQLSAVLFKG
jgi:hypothetical protein